MVFHLTVTATTKKSLDDSYKIYMQICTLFFCTQACKKVSPAVFLNLGKP